MVSTTGSQPPAEIGRLVIPSGPSNDDALGLKKPYKKPLPLKPISYLHGEPQVIWDVEEVNQIIVNENLEYAMIGKFSYGWRIYKILEVNT
ncbi:hypothetical protein H5410_003991 [Solanum commersonii]|uniref:Uncharacterized protein n=1 Tax=Solanum commersonii TaxID=4109 RepID=A0A9J6B6P7_SOLCO|nr:hypothetical protein H5410_003991 [Solanum commersonii]